MPLSKQRNKHIQRALVEAAKLAPRQSRELAVVYDREKQRGNGNRATLAVAPKGGCLSACRGSATTRLYTCGRTQDYGSISTAETDRMNNAQTARSCRLPTERRRSHPEALYELFWDWQRTLTQSSVTAPSKPETATCRLARSPERARDNRSPL